MDRSILPRWFQKLGLASWMIVGIFLVIIGAVWLLGKTSTIAEPLIAGAVIAAVGGAGVDYLQGRRLPRPVGAGLIMLALSLVAVGVVLLVLGGITSQASHIDGSMSHAVDKVKVWVQNDLNISSAQDASHDVKTAVPDIGTVLLKGVLGGIEGLKSILVFLGFSAFITFFLLMDGPKMGRWIENHMGMPPAKARVVTGDIVHALRKYFLGLTIVGLFNALVVTAGALILGVPLVGTIAVVTFLASYVPIVGAWTAGFFVFALALADKGTSTAFIMALIVFLANGPLQQIVQPIAYGATLEVNPLVVFVVTIASGLLFGMVGLILGAPLVSAGVHISRDLSQPAAPPEGDVAEPAEPPPEPAPEVV